jgi:type II secretory pathway component PulF
MTIFASIIDTDIASDALRTLLGIALWIGGFLFVLLVCYGIFTVLSLPLRRQERARLFLDLLETGMKQGRSPEQTIVSLAKSRDRCLDVWFYLLAGYIEQGFRLEQALDKVPWFLPRRAREIFKTGHELGDLRKILPVCRAVLRDAASNTMSTQNNLGVVLFCMPLGPIMVGCIFIFVLPKIRQLVADMLSNPSIPLDYFSLAEPLAIVSAVCWLAFYAMMCLQNGGPRFVAWFERVFWIVPQRCELLMPWQHKRLQRDFSALLGMLLDAGLPEPRAIAAAAEATGNRFFQQRARAAIDELAQGAKLADAARHLDKHGEFKWRLENAAAGSAGFANALAGWRESLDAKAFAQQQTVSQIVTTAMVFLNGAMVAMLAIGFFKIFLIIITGALLW